MISSTRYSHEDTIMSNPNQDAGVIQTLLDRLNSQRLPFALALKEKVDQGGALSDYDIRRLEEVFADTQMLQPMVERHPEYQDLASRILHLYKEILDKATENEKKA
jgi:hypothetical protein